MKCPVCEKATIKSRVNLYRGQIPDEAIQEFYDEEGDFHRHETKYIVHGWTCTNGHGGVVRILTDCPSKAKGCNHNGFKEITVNT